MDRRGTIIVGAILMAIGAYLLLSEYGFAVRINITWPLIMVGLGVAMLVAYYTSKPQLFYIQAGSILITLGGFFFIMHTYLPGPDRYATYWPGIIISVGLGFLMAGILGRKHRYLVGTGVFVMGVGILLAYFHWTEWRWESVVSGPMIIGVVLLLGGVKVLIDFLFSNKVEA